MNRTDAKLYIGTLQPVAILPCLTDVRNSDNSLLYLVGGEEEDRNGSRSNSYAASYVAAPVPAVSVRGKRRGR